LLDHYEEYYKDRELGVKRFGTNTRYSEADLKKTEAELLEAKKKRLTIPFAKNNRILPGDESLSKKLELVNIGNT